MILKRMIEQMNIIVLDSRQHGKEKLRQKKRELGGNTQIGAGTRLLKGLFRPSIFLTTSLLVTSRRCAKKYVNE